MNKKIRIGIIGYSVSKFDVKLATSIIDRVYDLLLETYSPELITIVSGLTDVGVPRIAYHQAQKHGLNTVGIACSLAKDFECFPVGEEIIVGDEWGEESSTFLKSIDILVKIGGGLQSEKEFDSFTGPKYNFELAQSPNGK